MVFVFTDRHFCYISKNKYHLLDSFEKSEFDSHYIPITSFV